LRPRGLLVVFPYVLVVALLTLGSGLGTSLAQDDLGTPATDSGEVQVDQSADEQTEAPVDEESETPDESDPAVDEPAIDEQPNDAVDGQPEDVIDEPEEIGTPGGSAPPEELEETPTPSPTTASPVLAIEQPTTLTCELAPEQSESILSGGTQLYDCRAELGLTGTAVDPSQVLIEWQIDVSTGGAWAAQLRTDAEQPWPDLETPPVLTAQSTLDDVVAAGDGAEFVATEDEQFQLLITRPACDTTPATIQVQVSASPSLDGAPVGTTSLPEPLKVEPSLAAIGQPVVTFDGPLNFGSVDADASGPAVSELSGTLGLTLSGMNATCGNWQVAIGGAGMVDGDGQSLPGSELLVLPTTDAGVPCDVRDGCPVAQVAADPSADPTQSLSLDLELRLGDAVVTGTFSTSLTVTITPLDGPTSDGNGE
jgi:hypothetical protein